MTKPSADTPRLAEYQLTEDEAKEFAQSGKWRDLTPEERGLLQLRQQRLLMEFSAFHEGISKLLDRGVWTHEFAQPEALWREYLGLDGKPSLDDVINKLPEHLRAAVIVVAPSGSPE